MINIENLTKSYGPQTLFRKATFMIGDQERIGVIGPNGAGKSTFFRVLMGEDQADAGQIRAPKNATMGLLRQEWLPRQEDSVLTSTLRVHAEWFSAKEKLEKLEPTSQEYHRAEETFLILGGYAVEPKAKELLSGLGFKDESFSKPCHLFSGGWRMRVQLAGLLLMAPDLLLLDEPTNHLDVESILWFEDFLQNYPKSFMIISHDRRLIQRLSTSILEFTPPALTLWPGGFAQYETDKAVRMEQIQGRIENRQKEIDRLQEFADRFRAKASKARQAQNKLRSADQLRDELADLKKDMPIISKRPSRFRLRPSTRIPRVLVEFQSAVFGYGRDHPLFNLSECVIEGGKKIGIIGVNGVGKSTFLKTCAGELALLDGSVRRSDSVSTGYFAQHRMEELPLAQKAYDYLSEYSKGLSISELRGVAASLGLMEHDLDKDIRVLSGGEKARVSLSKIILERPGLLLLDEPTNHLDMEACDALVKGLRDYEGSVLVVSHNRDFLDDLVDIIYEIRPDEVFIHYGNYTDWLERRSPSVIPRADSDKQDAPQTSRKKTKEQKRQEAEERQKKYDTLQKSGGGRVREIEKEMESLGAECKELDAFLSLPDSVKDPEFGIKLRKRGELATKMTSLEEEWLEVSASSVKA